MVSFWDTSAIIPLLLDEAATAGLRAVVDADPAIVVWWGTTTEIRSALSRRLLESPEARATIQGAKRILLALTEVWSEVAATEAVRRRAERLLGVHAIRAADALQLAAALVWTRDVPQGHAFVCRDDRLGDAARREGFVVLPPSTGE